MTLSQVCVKSIKIKLHRRKSVRLDSMNLFFENVDDNDDQIERMFALTNEMLQSV